MAGVGKSARSVRFRPRESRGAAEAAREIGLARARRRNRRCQIVADAGNLCLERSFRRPQWEPDVADVSRARLGRCAASRGAAPLGLALQVSRWTRQVKEFSEGVVSNLHFKRNFSNLLAKPLFNWNLKKNFS